MCYPKERSVLICVISVNSLEYVFVCMISMSHRCHRWAQIFFVGDLPYVATPYGQDCHR